MDLNPRRKVAVFFVALIVIAVSAMGTNFYIDWLWFKSLNYQSVFFTMFFSRLLLRLTVGLGFFILFWLNLLATRPVLLAVVRGLEPERVIRLQKPFWETFVEGRGLIIFYTLISFIFAYVFSAVAATKWMVVQQYWHAVPFGAVDPIFFKDIGFYIFKLPFYQMVYDYLMGGIAVSAVMVGIIYLLVNPGAFFRSSWQEHIRPKVHLSILLALFFALKAWGYKLATFELLFSSHGVVTGASYADVHGRLLAYQTLMVIALLCAVLLLVNLVIRRLGWVVISVITLVAASFLLGVIYPAIIQKFRVLPNELAMEEPYIKYTIEFTRKAYGLEEIKRIAFPAETSLTPADLKTNSDTIKNIRLWDWQPLLQTYSPLQEIRPYYAFKDVDVDRYWIRGEYRQVALAVREMDQSRLAENAQTWVNQKLKYTHGYGLVVSPVNEVTGEGLPQFLVKNIPPEATDESLNLTRPEIYYGEGSSDYVITNTNTPEFDYPMGDLNAECYYEGTSGVKLSSFFRRLMFAIGLGDYKILLSSEINPESQILYYRNIHERVRKIAPFLRYDYDPYPILSGGKVYWMQDAYTVSDRFPYSEPVEGWGNYVRNAVKVVVDAYDGTTTYYISDPQDPIILTYSKIFPSLFKPLEEMPADLRQHLRYPEELFSLQARVYATYHMEDPQVFYNKEDKWNVPEELYGGKREVMKPYYVVMRLPGEKEMEYMEILPFSPAKRENMIGWLCARCDGDKYGQLLVYHFPKQKLVYGPMQIEARIDQDGEISKELTLWNQRGSSTFRGSLVVIPIEHSLLYIEPLYLQAEQSKMPELRRVIVVYGEKVVMEKTLEASLQKIFSSTSSGEGNELTENTGGETSPPVLSIEELVKSAYQTFQEAQKQLREGNWAGYGESMTELEGILKELSKTVAPENER